MYKILEKMFKKNNSVNIKGRFELVCKDKDGNIRWKVKKHNLVMNSGRAQLAILAGGTGSLFTFLAVGTSTTPPAVTQTTLGAEISTNGLSRAAATVSTVTTNVTGDTLQLTHQWTVTGSSDIEEVGIFNASSSGVMLGRAVTGTNNVFNGDTLTMTYQVVFA